MLSREGKDFCIRGNRCRNRFRARVSSPPEHLRQLHRGDATSSQGDTRKRLDELVQIYGWPGIALVGLEGCRAAWLVAQHAICFAGFAAKFHAVMEQAVESGNVPKRLLACLTDRIEFNENRPQLYGTVLAWNEMGELTCELEDPANVDARRTEVGLPPFEEDLAKHREEVEREGGKAPENYADHRHKGREWARRIGWT